MINYNLYQGDCLELMKDIPDKSVDMILCDLPFGKTQCSWDKPLDLTALWGGYSRVIKDNGAIVLFGQEPFSSTVRLSNLKDYKYDWIWKKPKGTGHLNAKRQPMRDYENIMVFYKKQCVYNPQYEKGEPYAPKSRKISKINVVGETTYGKFVDGNDVRNPNSGFRYPKQVIEFGVVERGTLHQTQKPVPLLEYLIKTYTNEGNLVLDNCMGSGSTGVAAINLNRRFIGMELDEKYFTIAKERIDNRIKELNNNVS